MYNNVKLVRKENGIHPWNRISGYSTQIGYTQFIVLEKYMLIHRWKSHGINIGKVKFNKQVGQGIIRFISMQFHAH